MGPAAMPDSGTESDVKIGTLTMDHPWSWLAAGWQDLRRAPAASLSYGLLFVVAGYVLTAGLIYAENFFLTLPLAAGFLLAGPVLAVGLYDISRRLEQREAPTLSHALGAWKVNTSGIGFMGVILMLIFLAWIRLATLLFALLFTGLTPTWELFIKSVLLSGEGLPLLIVGTAIGGVLAAVVFAISCISIPMLLDRPEASVLDAIRASTSAVTSNWRPMLLWAALIVGFIGVGIATFYAGLLVALPLIGHGTWHAYRDIVAS